MRFKTDLDSIRRFLEPKKPILFLDRNTPPIIKSRRKFNVILSPSFYWVRKEELPVKYEYQAKALAPSVFDGIVPEGDYMYEVFKQKDGTFLLFAYNSKDIISRITEFGIKLSQVNYFYFAQLEFTDIHTPIRFSDRFALVNQEGIVAAVPIQLVQESISLAEALKAIRLSRHRITLSRFNLIVDQKTFNYAASILLLFTAIYTGQLFLIKQEEKKIALQQQEIYRQYNLPQTTFQLNAIEQSINSRQKRQVAIRESLNELFKAPRRKGEYFQRIDFSKDRLSFELKLSEPKRAEIMKSRLGQKLTFTSIRVVGDVMIAEATI